MVFIDNYLKALEIFFTVGLPLIAAIISVIFILVCMGFGLYLFAMHILDWFTR